MRSKTVSGQPTTKLFYPVLGIRMASENKRQNAGPKVPVALPKVDSNQQNSMQTVSLEAALNLVVGSR